MRSRGRPLNWARRSLRESRNHLAAAYDAGGSDGGEKLRGGWVSPGSSARITSGAGGTDAGSDAAEAGAGLRARIIFASFGRSGADFFIGDFFTAGRGAFFFLTVGLGAALA